MNSKIYILLPTHNRRTITENFIACLVAQSYKNFHLILIDDGSTDGTAEFVESKITSLTIIKGHGTWWWAGSLQQGINWLKRKMVSDHDIVLFMNDDVIFELNFLEIAIYILKKYNGLLLPQAINRETGIIEETGVNADLKKLSFKTAISSKEINCLPTRGLFMRMSILRKIGNFHPYILPHYMSDYEFTIRARKMGIELMTSSNLLISFNETTTGFREFSNLTTPNFIKNYFSIKSTLNPLYLTSFIILTTPILFMPLNIIKIWLNTIRTLVKQIFFRHNNHK